MYCRRHAHYSTIYIVCNVYRGCSIVLTVPFRCALIFPACTGWHMNCVGTAQQICTNMIVIYGIFHVLEDSRKKAGTIIFSSFCFQARFIPQGNRSHPVHRRIRARKATRGPHEYISSWEVRYEPCVRGPLKFVLSHSRKFVLCSDVLYGSWMDGAFAPFHAINRPMP